MGPEDVVVCFLYRGELVVVCFLRRGVRLRVGRLGYCVWHIVTSMTYVLGGWVIYTSTRTAKKIFHVS